MQQVARRMSAEIELGTFDYLAYFPNGKRASAFSASEPKRHESTGGRSLPGFEEYIETWWTRHSVGLRVRTKESYRGIVDRYLIPHFGEFCINEISPQMVLDFRAAIANRRGSGPKRKTLTPKTINYIIGLLRQVMAAAALEFGVANPVEPIKRLKVQRVDIAPFSLEEVQQILQTVREDYRNYFTVRFFTGMRTGEINGLKWKHVDLERRLILVRETYAKGRVEPTKTDGSRRDINMSTVVLTAFHEQRKTTGQSDYVFQTSTGTPLDAKNVAERVWYPLLRLLNYEKRRPYQCRHTAATLWLAAGENPEWIVRQLGKTTTEMLFRVYSRYVPNLTRNDGSAMDRMLMGALDKP